MTERSHTTSRRRAARDRQRRDRAILQLWRDGWTGKKIATHLSITPAIVGNVVHKRGAVRNRRTMLSNGCAVASDKAWWEAYRVYFWRVMDGLFRQAAEHGDTCPPFVTIPEPADALQKEQIMQVIAWWARRSFNLPMIEVRIDQGQKAH